MGGEACPLEPEIVNPLHRLDLDLRKVRMNMMVAVNNDSRWTVRPSIISQEERMKCSDISSISHEKYTTPLEHRTSPSIPSITPVNHPFCFYLSCISTFH